MLLLRLSPLFPYNILNYALSLTGVPFGRFALASWIGMFPITFMYVMLGSAMRSLTELTEGSAPPHPGGVWFYWVGAAITLTVAVLIARAARKALREVMPEETEGEESGV